MPDPTKPPETPAKPKHVSEKSLPKEAPAPAAAPQQSAGEFVIESLAEPLRVLVKEKVAAGLPLRSAIEVSRAQIAHDAAIAASAKETKPATA